MRRLIQRYLLTFENSKKPCQSDAPQLTAERLGDSIELKDLITQLQGILRRREENKCPVNAAKSQPEVNGNLKTELFFGCDSRYLTQTRTATGTSACGNKTWNE